MPAVTEPIRFVGEDVSINFEQAPLGEVMHAILGDILQLDYVVDQPVTGEVTVRTRTPIPRAELFEVLESLLRANNVLIIRGSDGRFLVTGSANGAQLAPGVSNPRSSGAGFSTVIVPLQYISAANMAEILRLMWTCSRACPWAYSRCRTAVWRRSTWRFPRCYPVVAARAMRAGTGPV
jgi:general secretion pathway protein D